MQPRPKTKCITDTLPVPIYCHIKIHMHVWISLCACDRRGGRGKNPPIGGHDEFGLHFELSNWVPGVPGRKLLKG